MERPCGLITASNTSVPLKSISVQVEVKGFVADVSATLEYKNEESSPLEAIFTFPMDSDSAVYNFQAMVDGKTIVAEIKEREQAKDNYDDAISSGQEAFLLMEDFDSSDIFTCRVGNLPPECSATVSFSLVQELPLEADGALRFTLPAVLNPRYTPAGTQGPRITHASAPVDKPLYTLDLEAHFHSPHGISRIQSNCQVTPVEFLSPDKTSAKLSLVNGHAFDRDVELLVYSENLHDPSAILEAGLTSAAAGTLMADPTVMVNLFPRFPENLPQGTVGEFVFLMDRSGSMGTSMSHGNPRSRIQCAKDTLLLLLKSLPMGCYFNIYGFGSHFTSFFPKSVEYSQSSMQEALAKVKDIGADMGGTEILQPLSAIYSTPCVSGRPRQLFVFTDGEVSNTKEVVAEVQRNAHNHRCFSFGIGEGASTALIKGIAKAANGSHEFITGEDRMEPKVLRTLRYALRPSGTGLTLSWDLPPRVETTLLSQLPPRLFDQQRTIVYAQLKGKIDPTLESGVTLKYLLGEQQVQAVTRFSLKPVECRSSPIHHLAAKAILGRLEQHPDRHSEEVRRRLVELSTQANVICSQTAFIAINRDVKQPVQGPLILRDVPLYAIHQGLRQPVMGQMCSFATQAAYCQVSEEWEEETYVGCMMYDSGPLDAYTTPATPTAPEESPALRLIALQNADGSWAPDSGVESLLGLDPEQLRQGLPQEDIDQTLWITLLAVIWLHAFAADTKDEWDLLVNKSLSWVKAGAGLDLAEWVKAGNQLLNTSVLPETLGL
ncbi:von Willebrand factor A domain-containing protein 5A-like isoform X2 [Pristis pectinata]|uniref:von Willebrand factor A domain-containing protein 5A-like isoform X2 n=1 Tax=Pristis pectinata TaxID=685728 RepID=UPI00223DF8EB|nr:von Willebrand factor A domain-containing protein 5A-like isoform X2 [Pristis pectinata]